VASRLSYRVRSTEVVHGLLDHVARQVVDLLLGVAEGGRADGGAVELVRVALQLAPALTAALGAAVVVGVNLLLSQALSTSWRRWGLTNMTGRAINIPSQAHLLE
jgi:hypothetical protein